MKVQLGWLRELVDLPEGAREVGRLLTSIGFALDGLEGEGDQAVLEIDVGSNRGDALSHLGIARELAALTGRALKLPRVMEQADGEDARDATSITIEAPDLCPYYEARLLRGVVRQGPSPEWMSSRLLACGIRPIGVIVDVTNYVLLELGHPLHAFDMDLLDERRIVVRRARAGETMATLDGQERKLEPEMLVIADASRAVALAGVMGGSNSEIRDTTKDILLESAVFAPASIRRTSRAVGLHTEASHRFERGTNVESARRAANRAWLLLSELTGAETLSGSVRAGVEDVAPREITMRRARLRLLTGIDVPRADAERIVTSLGFGIVASSDESMTVRVPAHRLDVSREVDVIEEIVRLHGFDKVPAILPPARSGAPERKPWERSLARVRESLRGAGCLQALHFTFDDAGDQRAWAWSLGDASDRASRLVELGNPMAENLGAMRLSLLPALLRSLAGAVRRGEDDVRLFEEGPTFMARNQAAGKDETPAIERLALALAMTGASGPRHFLHARKPVDVLTLKGALLDALVAAGARREDLEVRAAAPAPQAAPGAADVLHRGARIGWLGRVHPKALAPLEIDASVHAAEVDLSDIVADGPRPYGYEPQSRFPKIVRDLCVVVDRTLPMGVILNAVTAFRASQDEGGSTSVNVESVELIDRWLGAGVPEDKASLTFSVTYRSPDRTLTQDEADARHQALLACLAREVGATLRT